jgi:hypothetical protein
VSRVVHVDLYHEMTAQRLRELVDLGQKVTCRRITRARLGAECDERAEPGLEVGGLYPCLVAVRLFRGRSFAGAASVVFS